MAYNAGSAFITIAPSFRGFNSKVAAHMKTIGAVQVPVEFKASTKPIVPPPIKKPVIKPEVDTRSAFAQIARLESRLDRLARGRFVINVGIAAAPLAIPALAASAGAAGALGAVGGAGLAGIAGFAAIAASGLSQVTESQEALTAATQDRTAAVETLRSAEMSLAAAVTAAQRTQVAAAQQVADAERALADARRSAGRAIADAERALADARRSASRSIADAERAVSDAREAAARTVRQAEEALADAREQAAQRSVEAQRAVVRAQEDLVASQDRVRRSLDDLHAAREQAKRDLADLAERTRDNALTVEGAEIGLIEAQQRLAELEASGQASSLDLRKARLDVAVAEDRLSDARQQAVEDAERLAAAEAAGIEGSQVVLDAQQQLEDARQASLEAQLALTEATNAAREAELESARLVADAERALFDARAEASESVADAERNLRQTRQDAARSIADAERDYARTRADSLRSVADAERALGRARQDAAKSIADAEAQVAAAQRDVAAASAAIAAANQARVDAMRGLNPAQQAAADGMERLSKAWAAFLGGSAGTAVLGAVTSGMDALSAALPSLARFITPVADALGDMFAAFGRAAASGPFQRFATTLGRFTGEILRDATRGILNLAEGFGNLLVAFMPLGSDMSDGLVGLTRRFRDWSQTVGQSEGFRRFVAYFRETGPLLIAAFAAVVTAIIEIGKALAPMAASMLQGLTAFAEWIAAVTAAHPWLVQIIAGFALLVAGVSALAKPLAAVVGVFRLLVGGVGLAVTIIKAVVFNLRMLWLVLSANPVGAVIAVIGLLVAGLITAYKTSDTFRAVVDRAWDAVKRTIHGAWENYIKPALQAMWRFIKNDLWPVVQQLWRDVIKPTFEKIGAAVAFAWDNVVKPIFAAWKAYFENVLFPVLRFLWREVIKPVFTNIGEFIGTAWRDVIKPIFQALGSFLKDTVAPAFERGVELIGNAWDKIRAAAKKPINFVINEVYNNGIKKGFDKVADWLGMDARLPEMDPVGGKSALPRPATPTRMGAGAFGGAGGTGGVGGMGDLVKKIGGKTWDWMKDKFTGPVDSLLARVGKSPWAKMGVGVGKRLASGALDRLKAAFGAAEGDQTGPGGALGEIGKAGAVLPAGSYRIGMPYLGYPGHYGADYPAPIGTPVFSPWPGRVIASYDIPGSNPYNNTPYASYGRVVKVAHTNGFTTLYAHLNSRIGTVGPVAAGQQIGTVGTNGNSTGPHLHFEAERSGAKMNPASLGLFDAGGLARTAGLMAKGPLPERVLDPRQTAAFERAMDRGAFDGAGETLVRLSREDMDYLAQRSGSEARLRNAMTAQKGSR